MSKNPTAPALENPPQQGAHPVYNSPPPEYAEAINCPALNAYQPNTQTNPTYTNTPQQSLAYPAAQVYPPAPPISNTTHTVHVVHQPVVIGQSCRFCPNGVVRGETDICCLVFLILLAIFTFPIGLVFLCCLGCATRRRCTSCRRIH